MTDQIIDGALYMEMIRQGAANLNLNKETVNDLNVFPIPDGDTGDNMLSTMVLGSSADYAEDADLATVSQKVASGMVKGARGNSGVILSRIFAGIAKGLEGIKEADVRIFGKALEAGITEAYGAVSEPVEGTILTVYRDAVSYANSLIDDDTRVVDYFAAFRKELHESLERTPELLAVLKKAGVVDSGGAGLEYIAEGMEKAVKGEKIALEGVNFEAPASAANKDINLDLFTSESVLEFGYCTEFLLRLQSAKVDVAAFDAKQIADYLNSIGNSVVCFKDDSLIKAHVHTKTPGAVLAFGQKFGEFLTIKIENMSLQHEEQAAMKPKSAAGATSTGLNAPEQGKSNLAIVKKKSAIKKPFGIVTVATGDGICQMFSDLGADVVISGGQSMNPTVGSFLEAFDLMNCSNILILPNNSNIILTAQQAAKMYDKTPVSIIASKSIGEGYAALSQLDTGLDDLDAVMAQANAALAEVVCGEVSRASRDTDSFGVPVHAGDYIGFCKNQVLFDDRDRRDVCIGLAEELSAGDYGVMLVICGASVDDAEADEITSILKAKYKWTEVIKVAGGQPIYDYILVLE